MEEKTRKNNIKDLREQYGLSRTQFCALLNIPYRTVQDWEAGKRKMPDYVCELIEYKLNKEIMDNKNKI